MPLIKKSAIILLLLLLAGIVRAPFERPLGRDMRAENLLPQPIGFETTEALGQTSAAIALGGLRSLVAAVLNFSEVVPAWEDRDWAKIFDTFKQIHTLQPETAYYWEAAAGYAAHDAYSDYRDRPGIPEWQRKLRRDNFFNRGEAYLDEGIHHLPEEIRLYDMKTRLRSDIFKPEHLDYAQATETLDKAVTLDKATDILRRLRLYLMSRVPERRQETLELVREIYQDPHSRYPSINNLLFSLQNEFPNAPGEKIPAHQIYRSDGDAIRSLFNHYQRREEQLPIVGVKETLDELIEKLELPYALNPFLNSDIKRVGINLSAVYDFCPLNLPTDPYADNADWAAIVDLFQEKGTGSAPTVRALIVVVQNLTQTPKNEQIPLAKIFPDKLFAIRDLANYELDSSHDFPRDGVREALQLLCDELNLPDHLNPLASPDEFPFNNAWMDSVKKWQLDSLGLSVPSS